MKETLYIICAILMIIGAFRHSSRGSIANYYLGSDKIDIIIWALTLLSWAIGYFIL